ncbi:hypothetical protein ACFZAD_35720 [Streptomyces iakyrus]|uniref:hypothetical protein n=1 Tax=Streptomyces iakyrus TaxID=68219 RepID=UPI0036E719CA
MPETELHNVRCDGLDHWKADGFHRKYLRPYGTQSVGGKLRERWLTQIFTPDRIVHCFVGHLARSTDLKLYLAGPRSNSASHSHRPEDGTVGASSNKT